MPNIVISNELHKLLWDIKAKYGYNLTPAKVLDYLIFTMDDEAREKLVQMIVKKAKEDGVIDKVIAEKVSDSL